MRRVGALRDQLAPAAKASPSIIDVHTHFYDASKPWPGPHETLLYRTVLPADFMSVASPVGVTGTVVVAASPELADNYWVLELARDDPSIVGLCGSVSPNRPEFAAEIRALASNPLFLGIRAGPPAGLTSDSLWWSDMELLAELDLQLDVLVRPFTVEVYAPILALAKRLPDLRIVINHIAMLPVVGPEREIDPAHVALMQEVAAHGNIFMKVRPPTPLLPCCQRCQLPTIARVSTLRVS